MRLSVFSTLLLSAFLLVGGLSATHAEDNLIPREVLFGTPAQSGFQLSPNGEQVAFVAPLDGVLNLWVAPVDDLAAAQAVTADRGRGIPQFIWALNGDDLIYLQDQNGDENWQLYRVPSTGGEALNLTPFPGVQAQIVAGSEDFPDELVIGLNNRQPQYHDLYRVNIRTGDLTLIEENPGYAGYLMDSQFNIAFTYELRADGSTAVLRRMETGYEEFLVIPFDDSVTTGLATYDEERELAYVIDSRDRDTAALIRIDLATGESTLIAENDRADVSGVVVNPVSGAVEAVSFTYARPEWQIVDPALADDFAILTALEQDISDGSGAVLPRGSALVSDMIIVSRTPDNALWLVAFNDDNAPVRYYLYDNQTNEARPFAVVQPELADYTLAAMHPTVIPARDGLNLVSYYTLPSNADRDGDNLPEAPLPLVVLVHGGPNARDAWGYNAEHQWLASRGYAVLSINFRGSTGFGKDFLNAGNRQWGLAMQDDLIDGLNWAVDQGIADPARVAIMGSSYGGYAALAGLAFTPETFECGVSIVGPSNLVSLLEAIPAFWEPLDSQTAQRIGEWRTAEGRAALLEVSPLNFVEQIERPLLVAQGANDPRVPRAESDQLVAAMREQGSAVTYLLYPDEGHGFTRPENALSFYAAADAFLSDCLGGSYEPFGDDFSGASFQVVEGGQFIPGLNAALQQTNP